MHATLVFDEGPNIGLGHRRRMEVLGDALRDNGFTTDVRPLRLDEHVATELLIVDSYLARPDDRERFDAETIVAIEDLERELDVDLVIDPDPGAEHALHERAGAALTGPQYALIDPYLRTAETLDIGDAVRRVVVTTGGADAAGIGARIASDLALELRDAEVRLVVGPWGAGTTDPSVRKIHAPYGLRDELAAADLVVTAGGVTMLEACCLGRPTVAISIASNQHRAVAGAAHVGAVLAADGSSACGVATRLAGDTGLRQRIAATAKVLVDGQGATRVAAAVAAISSHESQLR
jgi:spore coat polysaccharide biosynthesis predicted glycosyltransferase SpsG